VKTSQKALMALSAVLLAACTDSSSTAPAPQDDASLSAAETPVVAELIPDQYIVVFKESVADAPGLAKLLAAQEGATVRHAYGRALKGFSGKMSAAIAARLRAHPAVAYVEQDQVVTANTTQTGATWGLDRIDQRGLPVSTTYDFTSTGTGVTAYIIDTGIEISHGEFGGRASVLSDHVGDGRNGIDCNGHGTHVAGTVGSATWGVAKNATLKAVRVLNCSGSGSNSGVIAGIDAVTADHAAGAPAVANMSLGGGFSQAVNDAVTRSINDGVTYALAAGNGDFLGRPQDACNSSPASTPSAITVGATTSADHEASFSNYGTCVDILAPGVSITSTWLGGTTNTISGTSMATPHVAGAVARYLSTNPSATPAAVRSFLVGQATSGAITLNNKRRKTPNLLLYLTPAQ
jgi:subtilisin family serine protease